MNIKGIKQNYLHPIKMFYYNTEIKLFGAWRFFLKQQKQQEIKLSSKHYNDKVSKQHFSNCIIFTCNGITWHGGLADRIKGIVSVYDWCKNNNKDFKINFSYPFQLYNYLIPNNYNWLIEENNISYSNMYAIPKVCLMEPRTCNKKEVLDNQHELLTKWCDENLHESLKQVHVYTNMYRKSIKFSVLFNELFKPSEKLQEEIDKNLQNIGGNFISISFRFTTIMGDFTDCAGQKYTEENKVQLLHSCIKAVESIRKIAPQHDKILITADSERFLKYAKAKLKDIYIIPGKVGHIDYTEGDDVNMKTFLDFMLISKAEKVYLVKNKDMYNSAFARTAAMINNKDFEVINI